MGYGDWRKSVRIGSKARFDYPATEDMSVGSESLEDRHKHN